MQKEQLERYSRQIILENIGLAGQEKIAKGKVLLIGCGGLGSAVALYLTAAGVGTIGLADSDAVDLSNLQRQIIHSTADLNKPKVLSAQEKIQQLNPDTKVNIYQTLITAQNIADLIQDYDFILDCTDNFTAKFLINDACVKAGKPFSHGGISEWEGQTMTCVPGSACYRCVFSAPPAQEPQKGVLGAVPGILGTIQAAEALKYLLGTGELLTNRLLIFNALTMSFRTVEIKPNNQCAACISSNNQVDK